MAVTLYLRNTNVDTTCDATGPNDLSPSLGVGPNSTPSTTTSSTSYVEIMSFDMDVSTYSPVTGTLAAQIVVDSISTNGSFRFRFQAIDDSGCGVTNSSTYSGTFSATGTYNHTDTLTWTAADERVRISVEGLRASGHGNVGLNISTENVNTYLNTPYTFPASGRRVFVIG